MNEREACCALAIFQWEPHPSPLHCNAKRGGLQSRDTQTHGFEEAATLTHASMASVCGAGAARNRIPVPKLQGCAKETSLILNTSPDRSCLNFFRNPVSS